MKSRITAVWVFALLNWMTFAPTLIVAAANQTPSEPEKKEITRVRMGGSVIGRQIIRKVVPEYPKKARKERIEGKVLLHVIIGKDGKVQQIEVISGPSLLQRSALDAARQWEYRPTMLNGKPVEVDTSIEIIFSLNQ